MDLSARLSSTLADRYEVKREIGAGGMATVYLARDLKHNRKVAFKVLLALAVTLALSACGWNGQPAGGGTGTADVPLSALSDSAWAALVDSLSEPAGYFDTDNLISNERSYLHALAPLRRLPTGAYLGVGPDQNFSYLVAARPSIAFIVDIRRDNLLHHLLLRSLFALSTNRADYLARLHGRPPPANAREWDGRRLEEILDRLDAQPVDSAAVRATRVAVDSILNALPLPLSPTDLATVQRFHRAFIQQGTGLRFESLGRAPRPGYPSFRELLLETDARGEQGSYLVREEDFRWLKALHATNRVVPVVGNLAGPHALRAIGEWLRRRNVGVTAFYTSNVEYYLWGDGTFPGFVANVGALPWVAEGVIIRSVFEPGASSLGSVFRRPGYISVQLVQPAAAFLQATETLATGGFASYGTVISAGTIDVR